MDENNLHTITNNSESIMHVGINGGGSVAVMPGESRPFAIQELAPAWRPDPAAEIAEAIAVESELDQHIAALMNETAKELISLVPDMETSLLVALGEAEQQRNEPRKTLLAAIAEEQLARADREQSAAIAAAHISGKAE